MRRLGDIDLSAWRLMMLCQFWLWCQPMYWGLRRELRICQDILADDQASCRRDNAVEYSELLVSFARRRITHPLPGTIAFLDRPSALGRRVKTLLSSPESLRSRSHKLFCIAIGSAAVLAAPLPPAVLLAASLVVWRLREAALWEKLTTALRSRGRGSSA